MVDATQIQAVAAVSTFLAACVAVWATFRAPKTAAYFAETLRSTNERIEESRRLKLFVFTTLMQFRSQIASYNSVAALNLIDVVFMDSKEVREAWRDFHLSTAATPFVMATTVERYHAIIEKISRDLGLNQEITISDIRQSYYPKGLGEMDEAALLETQDKLQRFRTQNSQV